MYKDKSNIIALVSIYAVAFTIVLWYGLTHLPVNDGVKEYIAFLDNIDEGWKFRLTLVNSCIITTYLPALIQKVFGVEPLFIFRLIPALFYPLMPLFTFIIARRYMGLNRALVATFVVLSSSFFIFFPDIGRVGVAIGFMAGLMWALLERKMIWVVLFSVLIVFSHYGTAFVAGWVVGVTFLVKWIQTKRIPRIYLISLCLLVILTVVWHFGIAKYSGDVMFNTLMQTEKTGYAPVYGINGEPLVEALLDPETREPAVQEALLLNFGEMSVPKKIEVAVNWLVVILVSLGLYCTTRNRNIDSQFKIMSISAFVLILITIATPWLSIYYGGMRVYYSTTMLLATCFVFGADKVANMMRVPFLVIAPLVLIMYALSTSGIIYIPFGLGKYLPVVIRLS